MQADIGPPDANRIFPLYAADAGSNADCGIPSCLMADAVDNEDCKKLSFGRLMLANMRTATGSICIQADAGKSEEARSSCVDGDVRECRHHWKVREGRQTGMLSLSLEL